MNKELFKIIKNDEEYEKVLERIDELMDMEDSDEVNNEIDVLSLIVSDYEDKHYQIAMPDPIDAILFRMDQMNMKQKDMVPYFGSKSKVSEVLNRKTPLSLSMIRKLNKELGIPAEILLKEEGKMLPEEIDGIEWKKFPLKEMIEKKYITFSGSVNEAKERAEELVRDFMGSINPSDLGKVFCRQNIRLKDKVDQYAMIVWQRQVLHIAEKQSVENGFSKECMTDKFFDGLSRLSIMDKGPVLAVEFLGKYGIHLVINERLKKTYLDGAAMQVNSNPVIALTLRHDRIDNFWFSLFHELAHLYLHFNENEQNIFIDDLDESSTSEVENEADLFSRDKLISKESWEKIKDNTKPKDIDMASKQLNIHPAIIMGRLRFEKKDFSLYGRTINRYKVSNLFKREGKINV